MAKGPYSPRNMNSKCLPLEMLITPPVKFVADIEIEIVTSSIYHIENLCISRIVFSDTIFIYT